MAKSKKEEQAVEEKEPTIAATEEAAQEVKQGKSTDKKYKLANPKTSFNDRNFTLASDQEKSLPDDPSPELVERIRTGFIIEAK